MARKVFLFFAGISILVLLGMILFFSLVGLDTLTSITIQGGSGVLDDVAVGLQLMIVNPLSGLCLLLAIFASASFVPHMMERGTIDLLLSKPISRTQLLMGKYLGGLLVVFLNIFLLIFGTWLIISIKFSSWDFSFLLVSLLVTFTFAVLYSLIVFIGVLTKGSILGMMLAYLIFLIVSPLLLLYRDTFRELIESEAAKVVLDGFYYIIPKTSELMGTITLNLASGRGIHDFQPVITSLIFLILFLIFSVVLFRRKDF